MYISKNNYIYKSNHIERNAYLGLQQLKAELVESPKKDLIFKSNASLYIEKIVKVYKDFLKALSDGTYDKTIDVSLLYCLKGMVKREYKSTSLTNTILQDTINTIYGNDVISIAKYTMLKEDWTDAVFKYITSDDKTSVLTKDKVYPSIKNAPLLEIYIPKEVSKLENSTAINFKEEVRILLSKLGVINTLELIDILYSKVFIFDIK